MKILITGGAGFIGTHLTRHLLHQGHEITVLDSFLPQVHSGGLRIAEDLAAHVEVIAGDVADADAMLRGLDGKQTVVHLAAETGTGQSMYEVRRYERTNLGGTATLYELLSTSRRQVERVVVASSRAIYGEGAYRCERDGLVYPAQRSNEDKRRGEFDPLCPACGGACEMAPTPETAPMRASSFYGLTKQVQEQTALLFGGVLGIPTFALRYQNVYGPGQSLDNPYTGILAIFSNRARLGEPLRVFEDGEESRDFVYIDDVVAATSACVTSDRTGLHSLNVGSEQRTTILAIAQEVNRLCGNRSAVEVTGAFREGDIRHGLADIQRARELIGYQPRWSFRDGLERFLAWAGQSEPEAGGYERSLQELTRRGLLHGA